MKTLTLTLTKNEFDELMHIVAYAKPIEPSALHPEATERRKEARVNLVLKMIELNREGEE